MLWLAEEHLERLFEEVHYFDSDGEDYHGHNKRPERLLLLAPVFAFDVFYQFGNLNENLLEMKGVHREWINVSENAPMCQVAHKTYQLRRILFLYLLKCCLNIIRRQRGRTSNQQIRLDILIPPKIIIVVISVLFVDHVEFGVVPLPGAIPLLIYSATAKLTV